MTLPRLCILAAAICIIVIAPAARGAAETTGTLSGAPTPKALVDADFAIHVWKLKPRANETTATLRERTRTDLRKLVNRDLATMKTDADYWRLLAYLREYPWERLPAKWKDWYLANMPNTRLTDGQRASALEKLSKRPIYKMTPKEVDLYLGHLQETIPSLRGRVVAIARQNLGQPYNMYLLGEFPFEIHDVQPLFDLTHGDCVVFSEHTYAMALSHDWPEFFRNLMKLRYKNGEVGILTRNHFTEADWDKNNAWLVRDVTAELGATTVTRYTERIDRARFFANFGIGQDIPVQMLEDDYIPADAIEGVLDKLEDGDFVNIVRGRGTGVWVGHVGLVALGKDGTVNFIHSTEPRSVEVPMMEYVRDNMKANARRDREGRAMFMGMKFLKLRPEAAEKPDGR